MCISFQKRCLDCTACQSAVCPQQPLAKRCTGKHFTQERSCEKIVFGYDDVMHRDAAHPAAHRAAALRRDAYDVSAFWLEQPGTLIVTEGEMDKLACNAVRPPFFFNFFFCFFQSSWFCLSLADITIRAF